MKKELHPLVELARQAVETYINKGKIARPVDLTPEMKDKAGVFVSLKKHGQLRGCIGTFEPMEANVAEEIVRNAVSSAVGDPRFPPVKPAELDDLEYSVDVLTHPEPVEDKSQLDPKKYGLIVASGYRRGLLLPDLEGVNDVETQISICRQKAGIMASEPIKMFRFQVKRYR
jgi:AmmeMemoRadiSam system protein A